MKTLYLHVGYPKTGTTALQNFMMLNTDVLRRKGICYPHTGCEENYPKHSGIVNATMLSEEFLDALLAEIAKEAAESSRIVISCENFLIPEFGIDLEYVIGRMKKIADRVCVIVYLRRQDEWAQSAYAESINSWPYYTTISPEDPDLPAKIPMSYLMNTRGFCDYLAQIAGKENLIVRIYEKQQLLHGCIFADFLDIFGLPITEEYKKPADIMNPGLCRDSLEFVRLNNCILSANSQKGRIPGNRVKEWQLSLGKANPFGTHRQLSANICLAIIEKYRAENEEVARKYMGRADGILFRDPLPDASEPYEPYSGLSEEKAFDIISFAAERVPQETIVDFINTVEFQSYHGDGLAKEAAKILLPAAERFKDGILNSALFLDNPAFDLWKIASEPKRTGALHIWQYWDFSEDAPAPDLIKHCNESVLKCCFPGIRHALLNRYRAAILLPDLNLRCFDLPPANAADYLRAHILSTYGGLWINACYVAFKSLAPVIEKIREHGLVYTSYSKEQDGRPLVAFMGAMPGHPIFTKMKHALDGILQDFIKTGKVPDKHETGTLLLSSLLTEDCGFCYPAELISGVPIYGRIWDLPKSISSDAFGQFLESGEIGAYKPPIR
ncbi:MAG: hypothetical protein A2020_07350 [Lentisphaerae bacterium GWF2_45_14]|nr:MAG: hypothetical protein A2020_07350 [Lentisphaerae bacterium GWF2_45_14]